MSVYPYCREGASPTILINNQDELTEEQYREVLTNVRRTVEAEPLVSHDNTERGAKSTVVNWGLCSGREEHYPDPRMHIFPKAFNDNGRVSELEPPAGHHCHLRKDTPEDGNGCFWHCRVFQSGTSGNPDRESVLRWIDEKLEESSHDNQ